MFPVNSICEIELAGHIVAKNSGRVKRGQNNGVPKLLAKDMPRFHFFRLGTGGTVFQSNRGLPVAAYCLFEKRRRIALYLSA